MDSLIIHKKNMHLITIKLKAKIIIKITGKYLILGIFGFTNVVRLWLEIAAEEEVVYSSMTLTWCNKHINKLGGA
ncbi:MAG: hypothetical protein K0U20_04005 [Proteobacteria bacterium]|nr:hypothetical protein [Pseudomonadota bacterium]MCH9749771.1 hypothetical protein [Pseudomonadota bacterium]